MGLIKGKQIASGSIGTDRLTDGAEFLKRDGSVAMTGDFDAGNQKIVNLAPGVAGTDAANVNQVNAAQGGLDPKDSCNVATAASLGTWIAAGSGVGKTLTSPDNNLTNNDFDGFTVSVGMRVLVKDGGPNANVDNGIYEVTQVADGASNPCILTRATDFDQDSEVTTGAFSLVLNGNTNAGTGWVVTTADPITVDTTAISWTQFAVAPNLIAGAGLVQNGNVIDVGAGTRITVNANDVAVDVAGLAGAGLEENANALRIAAAAAGDGLGGGAGSALSVNVDGTTIEINADTLRVAAGAAGAGLGGGGGSALSVNVDGTTIEIATDTLRIAAGAAGAGLTGGGGSALAVGAGNGIAVNANDVALFPNVTDSPTGTRPSLAANANGAWASTPVKSDKDLTPTPTSGDGSSTGVTPTSDPVGYVYVKINGVCYVCGDGVKTKDCYFSGDGGATAKNFNSIITTDVLYWNGVVVGFDLAGDDQLDLDYVAV